MNKESLIEKIKKLLALATDNSTTEHEKSSAMQKAQELMAEYSIEECDLNSTNAQDLIVKEKIIFSPEDHVPPILNDPLFFGSIVAPICQNFGCYTYNQGMFLNPYVMGFKTNVEIAIYACNVLINQGIADYKVGFKIHRSMGYSINFWTGFCEGLTTRFTKISNEKALVLYDKVREAWRETVNFRKVIDVTSTYVGGSQEGFKSATEAKLNPAISTIGDKLLK